MSHSFQKEKPPARINLFLELQEGEATEKVELPLRLLVVGDYTGRPNDTPVDEREALTIDTNNFGSVMRSKALRASLRVPNRLDDSSEELSVDLRFDDLDGFTPEAVAEQVPQLRRIVAMRNLLQDLRNRVVSTREFRKQLEHLVQNPGALSDLADELSNVVRPPAPAPASPDPAGDTDPPSGATH